MKNIKSILFSPYTLILIIIAFILIEYWFLGIYSYVRLGDNLDSFLSRTYLFVKHLKTFGIADWIPEIGMGVDTRSGDVRLAYFAVPFFLFFDYKIAYIFILLFCFITGGLYLYKLLVKEQQLQTPSAIAAVFTYMVYLHKEDLLWYIGGWSILPVCIYYLSACYKNRNNYISFLGSFFLGLLFFIFNHFTLTVVYFLVTVFLWFALFDTNKSFKKYGCLLIFFFTIVFFSYPTIVQLKFTAPLTHRYYIKYYNYGIGGTFLYIKNLTLQYFIPILFSIVALLMTIKEKRRKVYFSLSIIFVVIFICQAYGAYLPLLMKIIGKLANFPIHRFFILLPFFSALLIAYSLENISEECFIITTKKQFKLATVLLIFFILSMTVYHLNVKANHLTGWIKNSSNFGWTRSPEMQELRKNSSGLFRVITIADEYHSFFPGIAQLNGFETFDCDETVSARYRDFWSISEKEEIIPTHGFSFGWNTLDKIKTKPIEDSINLHLLGLANVKYILSAIPLTGINIQLVSENDLKQLTEVKKKFSYINKIKENFLLNLNGGKLYVYQNMLYQPRLFIVKDTKFFDNKNTLLEAMSKTDIIDLKNKLYLEKQYAVNKNSDKPLSYENIIDTNIELQLYSPNKIEVAASVKHESFLVVSNNYSPYWKAFVNGKESTILPAYHSFWAIKLPPGNHQVTFKYSSKTDIFF